MRIHVLPPGEPNGCYHSESQQEDFLVLSGECILIVEGEERRLKQWDFFHSPAGTEHIFVGAGDGPCAIFMCGSRTGEWTVRYPVSDVAAKHGASVEQETTSPDEAYADWEPSRRGEAVLLGRSALGLARAGASRGTCSRAKSAPRSSSVSSEMNAIGLSSSSTFRTASTALVGFPPMM